MLSEKRRQYFKDYYIKNKEKIRKQQNQNRDPEENKKRCKEYYFKKKKDIEWVKKERERIKAHRKNNLGKYAAKEAKRRTFKLNASVSWADQKYIEDLYKNCREAEDIFNNAGLNIKFHVDHIVPLQHDKVCGLHVEHNLQILTSDVNARKSNKYEVI
jgi:hypothetical protein